MTERPYRSHLLSKASNNVIAKRKVHLLTKWWFPTFIKTIDLMMSLDNAYYIAWHELPGEFERLKKEEKIK